MTAPIDREMAQTQSDVMRARAKRLSRDHREQRTDRIATSTACGATPAVFGAERRRGTPGDRIRRGGRAVDLAPHAGCRREIAHDAATD